MSWTATLEAAHDTEGTTMEANTIVVNEDLAALSSPQPCLRHISSIQIRNLSPFPARDSLASALAQGPAVVSGAGSGLASDDADILLGQRRKRRISSASIHTLNNGHPEHDHTSGASHSPISGFRHARNRSNSVASFRTVANDSSSPPTKRQVNSSRSETRPRARKLSEASVPEHALPSWQKSPSSSLYAWSADTLNSQKQLEEVIWSRLVETFLTISLPQDEEHPPISPAPCSSFSKSPNRSRKNTVAKRLSSSVDNKGPVVTPSSPTQRSRRTASVSASTASSHYSTVTPSAPSFGSINTATTPQSPAFHKAAFPQSPPLTPPPATISSSSYIPIYISLFHRPSTNPKFVLDPEDYMFARWTDMSTDRIIIRLWANTGTEEKLSPGNSERTRGKKKAGQIQEDQDDESRTEWRVLGEWDVNLSDLVPLPDDLAEHPWKLPANSLILTLSSSNRPYYIPSTLLGVTPTPSRPQTPEYNSDSEVSRRQPPSKAVFSLGRARRRRVGKEMKSANLNELVKLVSLQASLLDAQNILTGVLENCNRLIEEDYGAELHRDSSEREYRLQRLQEQRDLLDDSIKLAQDSLASRKEQLRQRRMRLAEARALLEDDLLSEFDAGVRLAEEKKRVQSLRSQIVPVRTSFLSTLAFIFPIELLSPPDLLYTILGVPLPIPLQGTDPAPPLSLPHVPAVSEDGVATALGYAALLVHLMAAYLCQRLVYPVTYVGSRSLVKDPISAMMGPRMFPLYSKGVDTYRFEYAVFLLNKDIEMLMSDRNLRALDLRHTLPNLKNLLLTLTSGEGTLPRSHHLSSSSAVSITPGLQSPSPYTGEATESGEPEPPSLSLEGEDVNSSTTPKGRAVGLPFVDDLQNVVDSDNKHANGDVVTSSSKVQDASDASSSSINEDRSGSSSGASALRPRLPRIQIQSYLGLAPLSSMWRGRGASSSGASSSKPTGTDDASSGAGSSDLSTSDPPDGLIEQESEDLSEINDDNDEDEEDDRRTVRGSSVPTTPTAESRSRRGSIAPDSMLDNLKDLKSRVHLRGGGTTTTVSSETEKRPDSVEDTEAVVDPAC